MKKNKHLEYWYLFAGLVFIILWQLIIRDLLELKLQIFPSFIAMIIYNLGFIGLIVLLTYILTKKVAFKWILFTLIIGLSYSLLVEEHLVSKDGIVNTEPDHYWVAEDVGFANLYNLFLPQSWLWLAVYIITPALLLLLIPVIFLKPKQIVRVI